MTCAEALQAMLEAEPSELEGKGESHLVGHLRDCPRCREMARTVLIQEEALGQGLAEAVALPDLDALLDQALGPKANPWVLRFRPRRTGLTLFPLAAAATLAALFLGGDPRLPGDPYAPAEPAPGLGLDVPEGRDVAVLATNDPKITVLWFF
jgi:predicted anti-sigma-YlaC factor YlaD